MADDGIVLDGPNEGMPVTEAESVDRMREEIERWVDANIAQRAADGETMLISAPALRLRVSEATAALDAAIQTLYAHRNITVALRRFHTRVANLQDRLDRTYFKTLAELQDRNESEDEIKSTASEAIFLITTDFAYTLAILLSNLEDRVIEDVIEPDFGFSGRLCIWSNSPPGRRLLRRIADKLKTHWPWLVWAMAAEYTSDIGPATRLYSYTAFIDLA